jgi:hypothetical protein
MDRRGHNDKEQQCIDCRDSSQCPSLPHMQQLYRTIVITTANQNYDPSTSGTAWKLAVACFPFQFCFAAQAIFRTQ